MEGSLADHSEFLKNLASFFAIIATTFDYLPVLVMYSAVKRFGGTRSWASSSVSSWFTRAL